ncbi:MAG: MbtH family NRPS accessory protein [Actinobacteria bacterium]|nr:MbtH family NRPS accessory protein [Actinomycetota bacterium]MCB9412466.1 MbtH family NRPS accessory protein [Actinomycetota bacterium]
MELRLHGVNEVATEFSDRPARRGWVLPIADLAASWYDLFGDDPPNAVLSYSRVSGEPPESVVLEIDEPRYDPLTATLTLQATLIPVVAQPHPSASAPVAAEPLIPPPSFATAALFIDSTEETPSQPEGTFEVLEEPDGDGDFNYSVWPTDRPIPAGWTGTGFEGTWSEAVAQIEQLWTEQRPASLSETLRNNVTTAE